MDTQIQQRIIEQIQTSSNVGIAVGKNPSIDQMAAGLGLYLALKKNGKNVVIASPTQPIVEISNLVGIDKVKTTLTSNGGDLIVSFPYREGEIEKVKYTLDEEKGALNIIVEAGEKGLNFDEKEVKYVRTGKAFDTFFTIGAASLNDISSLYHSEQITNAIVIAIDNHAQVQQFGQIMHVSMRASSISEQIADILTLMEQASIVDIDIAQNLLSGIISATNDFQEQNTTSLAFEMAGILMRKGAIRQQKQQDKDDKKHQEAFMARSPRPQPTKLQPQQPRSQQGIYQPRQDEVSNEQRTQTVAPMISKSEVESTPLVQSQQINQPFQIETITQQSSSMPVAPIQEDTQKQAPADWLTPKVYKGSSIV